MNQAMVETWGPVLQKVLNDATEQYEALGLPKAAAVEMAKHVFVEAVNIVGKENFIGPAPSGSATEGR